MAIGKKIETRGHVVGFREEIDKSAAASEDLFFTWFNDAKDKHASFVRGEWDFMIHMGTPAAPFLSNPEEKIALEIGHGGGRILAAASRSFKAVIGVDIHNNNEKVSDELLSRGINNFRLIQTDGTQIPLEEGGVDFVYSFIVLQHVEKMAVFEAYFRETYRILKPGGIAVLYFGRQAPLSINRRSVVRYWLDRLLEVVRLRSGYREVPAKVNATNLLVTMPHAKRFAKRLGFSIMSSLVSRKTVPNGVQKYGGQHGLVLKK